MLGGGLKRTASSVQQRWILEGYYRQHNGKNMMALKNAEASEQEKRAYEELIARIHKEYVETEQKVRINGCLSACEGKPMSLVLTARNIRKFLSGKKERFRRKHRTVHGRGTVCKAVEENGQYLI